MKNKHEPLVEVWLRCQECGTMAMIWRRNSRLKEKGHVKHMWCTSCMERTAHVEERGEHGS